MASPVDPSGRPPARPRDPYGLMPVGAAIGPLLAALGLVVVAVATWTLLTGRLPVVGGGGGGGNGGGGGVATTPAPSNVVIVPKDPKADVPGTIVYAKQGSIWLQTGSTVRQLTAGAQDSQPAWTSDGRWIYFIRTITAPGLWPGDTGRPTYYTMHYPMIMRVAPEGGDPEQVATGRFTKGKLVWFTWLREPTPNPVNPDVLALTSDQPDPTKSDVVLQLYDVAAKKYTVATGAKETPPLGHQDPAWHPNGKTLLYVKNDRDGRQGTPSIWRYDTAKNRISQLTGPGYLSPSYSPDGRYVTATKTTPFGTDVVILDGQTGGELLRVTNDGGSFSPVWSPRGDAIAFLHVTGQIVDLRMVTLAGTAPSFAVKDTIDLTEVSGLDGASRPSWYIPADQLPPPSPSPAISPTASSPTTVSPSP
jgi:dipeptidyl aminopeptidase/acylaminoacyl peptidase